ncbi:hypothetical protein [Lacticaseibacillus nasuensis]|uniref:hypothetical protein n=1 Tax=Lacticaseibacillus nasuensis TaxID=944671 RepID=UPI002247AB4C|nr:hypothetical protein [Lacticaseibacillus nasuensis]MCX2455643.1 hypothetical protein [Lacticaseibacillus nasuensis]
MNNETKRDVFDAVVNSRWRFLAGNTKGEPTDDECMMAYDAALPDNLPVIPKAVGEYIQWGKSYDIQLYMMYSFKFIHSQGFKKLTDDVESWIISSSNAFARAWLLGTWRVEETIGIVKFEAEK